MSQAIEQHESLVFRFKTAAAVISRFGSEQLRDHFTAVIELVKNAYDADATRVRVEFKDINGAQALRIQDDGSGMSLDDLHTKWGVIATENKLRQDRSAVFRRRRLGQKGVGRFAAEKLGSRLILRTRVEGQPKVYQVRFNWDEFCGDSELREHSSPIAHTNPEVFEPTHGTRLDIRDLRRTWHRSDVVKLRNQLSTLIDPDTTVSDFRIQLVSRWGELSGVLSNPLPGNETHRLEFELDMQGRETIVIWENGQKRRVISGERPSFGPLRGILRYYGQGLQKTERARGGDADADWNVGVRIFRDGCRVRPYGEPGAEGDWLQIYRTRYLKGSRFRLKPHYLEGAVHITKDANPDLRDTTSREGLVENEAYRAVVDYLQSKIAFLSDIVRDEEQREERKRHRQRYERALHPLTAGLSRCGSEAYRRAVNSADKTVRKALRVQESVSVVRNAHWECADCGDSWKVPKEFTPTHCREYSVGKDGKPTFKPGCGSTNVRRKGNIPRGQARKPEPGLLDEIIGGVPAYVSGIQVRPIIDWEMGERDEEAEVRPERRELAINGRHPAFRTADMLDGTENVEGTEIEALRAVAGLTTHIVDAASLAWGRWHFQQTKQFEVFSTQYSQLKEACLSTFQGKVAVPARSAQGS